MGKLIKIIKINLLSVIALPLLLVATASKLIAKALEKIAVIAGMFILTLGLVLLFEALKAPGSILWAIVIVIVFFLVIAIIFIIIELCFAVLVSIWGIAILIFNTIYEYTYMGYFKLYEICTTDFALLSNLQETQKGYYAACLFYSLLKGVSWLIIRFVSLSLYLSIGGSIFIVACSLINLNNNTQRVLGINLFTFMSKFDTFSLIYGIVMYLAIIATFVVTLISLGIEWNEWAKELKMTSDEYSDYIGQLKEQAAQLEASESDNESLQTFNEHMANVDTLEKEVNAALSSGDSPLLRSAWSDYLRTLTEILNTVNEHDFNVPEQIFRKKLVPRIDTLNKLRDNVQKALIRCNEEMADPVKSSVYFAGCNTLEKLEKRYKSLCKAYHPDSEGGDEESFKNLQNEYEKLKAHLS